MHSSSHAQWEREGGIRGGYSWAATPKGGPRRACTHTHARIQRHTHTHTLTLIAAAFVAPPLTPSSPLCASDQSPMS